jgi:DUF4097 and DUF4098 domain-containing protein YvlB
MGSININGKTYTGNNIIVNNDDIIIDGKSVDYDPNNEHKIINVHVDGNLESLKCNTATINGDVFQDVKCNTLKCEAVGGDVKANTVKADYIQGNVKANTVKTK